MSVPQLMITGFAVVILNASVGGCGETENLHFQHRSIQPLAAPNTL
jgi:hypothetical protein